MNNFINVYSSLFRFEIDVLTVYTGQSGQTITDEIEWLHNMISYV